MSMVTRPVNPKAVVWNRPGKLVMHHLRISTMELEPCHHCLPEDGNITVPCGSRNCSCLFRNRRCGFVNTSSGRLASLELPLTYPESNSLLSGFSESEG